MHVCAHANKGQKRSSDPLELELQTYVSFLTRVLGTKLGSSVKVVHNLKHLATPPSLNRGS